MNRSLRHTALCLLVVAPLGCADLGTAPPPPDPPAPMRPLTVAEKAVVSAGNDFGFNLFVTLNREVAGQNLFISPLSVSMALGMTMNGANGATRTAMQTTLGFGTVTQQEINRSYSSLIALLTGLDPTVRMQIANSIWYRPTLVVVDSFRTLNMQYFNAEVNSVDFSSPAASATINGWVDRATNGKITEVVPQTIPREIMMYLINAIYFKGTWTYRFDPKDTRAESFTLASGTGTSCRMMTLTDTLSYASLNEVQVADVPYGGGAFSMTVILPPPGVNIDSFVGGLTQQEWDAWMARLERKCVRLSMPKFRIEYRAELPTVLSAMGMGLAFSDAADFTGIDARGGLKISDVIHKTFVQVDEEGTEAAAVTAVGVGVTSIGGGGIVYLRLDRPFLYLIREHQSGSILFMGKLAFPVG